MSSQAVTSAFPLIRELSFDDYSQISLLETQRGLASKKYEEWTHLWTGNPVYSSLPGRWPLGWVLQHNGRIVGAFANIPLLYEYNGKSIITATGRGWVVDPAYCGYAPMLLDEFLNQPNVDLCLSTTANFDASRILEALGALRIPVGCWDKSEIWITNYRGFAKAWLTKRHLPATLTYVLAPTLFVKGTIAARAIKKHSGKAVERCIAFDDRFNEFWQVLRLQKPGRLLAVRTRAMLEWHFRYPLMEKRIWIQTINQQGRLIAYAIFLEQQNQDSDMPQLLLVDFQALDNNDALIYPILASVLRESQRQKIYLLEKVGLCIGNKELTVAPHLWKRGSWSHYYKTRNGSLSAFLNNQDAWAPSMLDGDSTL
ncbi:MAG TPA: hypothetical protein VFA71_14730 [Terriglobales bacterium]|nr:hypothetical protein [Terriglobales bacterium]